MRVALSALIAAALALLLWAWNDGVRPGAVDTPPSHAVAELAAGPGAPPGPPAAANDGVRRGVAEVAAPITIRGRVVAAESGAALAGARVEARARAAFADPASQPAAPVVVTGDDGRFELAVLPVPGGALAVQVGMPGRATLVGGWQEGLRAAAVIECGDIALELGAELSLRVRDARGEAVPGFSIQLQRASEPSPGRGPFAPLGWGGLVCTDASGVAGPRSVGAGSWLVTFAEGTGHVFQGPRGLEVPRDRTQIEIELQVADPGQPESTVSGVLVDEAGVPLVGIEIAATQPLFAGTRVERSFVAGRFHIPGLRPERGAVTLARVGPVGEYEILEPRDEVVPGTHDVRAVVRRVPGRELVFVVRAASTGAPVERLRWNLVPVAHDPGGTRLVARGTGLRLRPMAEHPRGRLVAADQRPGPHLLVVVPDDPQLQPVLQQEVEVGEAMPMPTVVEVGDARAWRVRVVDREGHAVAGSVVEFVRGVGRTLMTATTSVVRARDAFDGGAFSTYVGLVTSEGRSDAGGRVALRTAAPVCGGALRVRGPRHRQAFAVLTEDVPAGGETTVVVAPAGRIVGRLGPEAALVRFGPSAEARARAGVYVDPEPHLDRLEVELRGEGSRARCRVGDEGSFAFDALGAGSYTLSLRWPGVSGRSLLADAVVVRDGEERALVFDLAGHLPARIRGRVRWGEIAPPDGTELQLGSGRVRLDASGAFTIQLAPGAYACSLQVRTSPDTWCALRRPQPLRVEAGADLDLQLDFPRRRVDVHVVDAQGRPMAGKWLRVHTVDGEGRTGELTNVATLDGQGRASLPGTWDEARLLVLWLDPPEGPVRDLERKQSRLLGRVAVPAHEAVAAMEFRVPDASAGR